MPSPSGPKGPIIPISVLDRSFLGRGSNWRKNMSWSRTPLKLLPRALVRRKQRSHVEFMERLEGDAHGQLRDRSGYHGGGEEGGKRSPYSTEAWRSCRRRLVERTRTPPASDGEAEERHEEEGAAGCFHSHGGDVKEVLYSYFLRRGDFRARKRRRRSF
jgi:hypothetical protein